MGRLGQHEQEGEKVGQPEVVGCDGGVLLRGQLSLVHEASSGFTLQLRPHVARAVNPAVRPGGEEGSELMSSTKVHFELCLKSTLWLAVKLIIVQIFEYFEMFVVFIENLLVRV